MATAAEFRTCVYRIALLSPPLSLSLAYLFLCVGHKTETTGNVHVYKMNALHLDLLCDDIELNTVGWGLVRH